MTIRVLVSNMGEDGFVAELQGRSHDGKIFPVSEGAVNQGEFQAFTIYRLQHVMVKGPGTVMVTNDGPGSHTQVKLEHQGREHGQFSAKGEQLVDWLHFGIARLEKGEQLLVMEAKG